MGDLLEIKNKLKQDFDDVYYKGQLKTLNNYESFKGETSGVAIAVNDVSSVNHNVGVQLRSKNLWNHEYDKQDLTNCTSWTGLIWDNEAVKKTFKPNTAYTIKYTATCLKTVENASKDSFDLGFNLYYNSISHDMGFIYSRKFGTIATEGESVTIETHFTTPNNLDGFKVIAYTQVYKTPESSWVQGTFSFDNIMLEEGTTATAYTPYVADVGGIEVSRYGKNLFDKNFASVYNNWALIQNSGGYWCIPYFVGKGNTVTVSYKQDLEINLDCPYTRVTLNFNESTGQKWLYHKTQSALFVKTATVTAVNDYIYILSSIPNDATLSKFMQYIGNDLQIEISPTATSYEPYFEPTTYTAKADGTIGRTIYGKNLFDVNLDPHFIHYAVSLVSLNDGELTIKQNYNIGYASYSIAIPNANNLVGKTITVSCDCKVGEGGNNTSVCTMWLDTNGRAAAGTDILYKPYVSSTEYQHISVSGVVNAQPDESYDTLALMFYGNVSGTLSAGECYAYFKNIQVEIGTTATPYEPYQEPVFEGVKSISPNMTLLTNNSDTVINCNYLRDIDKYINNLTTNIALTGGE